MKVEISSCVLADALARASALVTSRMTLPELSCVALRAEQGLLRLTVNNLDQSLTFAVPATVPEVGEVLLPARRLLAIVREMPEGTLSIHVGKNWQVSICVAASHFKVMGMGPENFPPLGNAPGELVGEIPGDLLQRCFAQPAHAMSSDETRTILNGVFFRWNAVGITAVATDGRRLAVVSVDHPVATPMPAGVVVPAKSVLLLAGLVAGGNVQVFNDGKRMTLVVVPGKDDVAHAAGEVRFTTKLVDGNFPDYARGIPQRETESMVVDLPREDFLAAVHRASLVTSEKSHSIKLDFNPAGLVITAQALDFGDAREELPRINSEHSASAAFNPNFLEDALSVVTQDLVTVMLGNDGDPALFTTKGYVAVVMPVRGT